MKGAMKADSQQRLKVTPPGRLLVNETSLNQLRMRREVKVKFVSSRFLGDTKVCV